MNVCIIIITLLVASTTMLVVAIVNSVADVRYSVENRLEDDIPLQSLAPFAARVNLNEVEMHSSFQTGSVYDRALFVKSEVSDRHSRYSKHGTPQPILCSIFF